MTPRRIAAPQDKDNTVETYFDEGSTESFNLNNNDENADTVEKETIEKLSSQHSKRVNRWRLLVLLLILAACAVTSTAIYFYIRNEEKKDSMESYEAFAQTVQEVSAMEMKSLRDALRGVADTLTATAVSQNTTFPFVTTPMFEVAAGHARKQAGVEMFTFTPIVSERNRLKWNNYSVEHEYWLQESLSVLQANGVDTAGYLDKSVTAFIFEVGRNGQAFMASGEGIYAPAWQSSPPPFDPSSYINYNMLAEPFLDRMIHSVALARDGLMSEIMELQRLSNTAVDENEHTKFHQSFVKDIFGESYYDHPHSVFVQPVFHELGNINDVNNDMAGMILAVVAWDRYLANLLPSGVNGINAVLSNNCGQDHTYVVNGPMATYLGAGDLHETEFDDTETEVQLSQFNSDMVKDVAGHCVYKLNLYSSSKFESDSTSRLAIIFGTAIAGLFGIMALTFLFYDYFVRQRNQKVVSAAARSDKILSSYFPKSVRDRLFAESEEAEPLKKGNKHDNNKKPPKSRLKNFLDNGEYSEGAGDDSSHQGVSHVFKSKPIADHFPETTLFFGDIAGFTAWSSTREPSQVFTLLETLYAAFDEIAQRRRVYKVETVGDCYVAVTGLPDPNKQHAIAMCRFARECMFKMQTLTKKLEIQLGPDTGDLALRVGLHSGPVTGGVLRGEKSRFQLFGDTMNTASRMESNGMPGRIQISEETAELLAAAGKSEWFEPREDKIIAKGKGELQTYWLRLAVSRSEGGSSVHSSEYYDENNPLSISDASLDVEVDNFDQKTLRLIDWNVDVLLRLLRQVVARRLACPPPPQARRPNEEFFEISGGHLLQEVQDIITLPKFNARAALDQQVPEEIDINEVVVEQLHDFVCNIAALYRENAFHNFEHASHVVMSMTKLLSHIVAPSEYNFEEADLDKNAKCRHASTLHDQTFGITSDPLTHFACAFSALIHDCDHVGVPNSQLAKENPRLETYYQGKSLAEQNAIELAWNLLMDEAYVDLRAAIYTTDVELRRFRALVVNATMATDLFDQDLRQERNQRWKKAFSESAGGSATEGINRRATVVIEHLLQASDVAHTMQHWHVYRKWNERFFQECTEAYWDGRAAHDPAVNWYEGELAFFDHYVIPLAKKLKDCGVFGVSGGEYLTYATKNRQEWYERGNELVDEMIDSVNKREYQALLPARTKPVTSSTEIQPPTKDMA